jgi:hypothetical protein
MMTYCFIIPSQIKKYYEIYNFTIVAAPPLLCRLWR